MSIFSRVLGGNIFYDFWKQARQYIFTEKRLIQLLTMQPIEIYHDSTELEVDTAKVQLYIRSNMENLMQRRLEKTFNLLTLNSAANKDSFVYDFDIVIKAQAAYEEVSKFFNHHFAKQTYTIEEKKYYLFLDEFKFTNLGTKMQVNMPFMLDAKWGPFRRKMSGTAVFKGSINFHQPKYVVKTRNLNYDLDTDSFILRWIDRLYHDKLILFLQDFLQYNFKEELFFAKTEAQLQINSFQSQNNFVNGSINELDLERITIEPDGLHAIFVAEGKLHVIR